MCHQYDVENLLLPRKKTGPPIYNILQVNPVVPYSPPRTPSHLALAVERPLPKNDGVAAALPMSSWQQWTWSQYDQAVRTAAKGFIELGTPFYGSVTIFGFNAPEWHISSLAAMCLGGKCAGIYPSDTAEHCAFKNAHSGATVAVVEDDEKVGMTTFMRIQKGGRAGGRQNKGDYTASRCLASRNIRLSNIHRLIVGLTDTSSPFSSVIQS